MTPEETTAREIALWREHVGWRPGMVDDEGVRVDHVCEVTGDPISFGIAETWKGGSIACVWQPVLMRRRAVPDFTDDGTRGVLVGVAREKLGADSDGEEPCPRHDGAIWRFGVSWWSIGKGPTESLAILEAIAAAPEVTS